MFIKKYSKTTSMEIKEGQWKKFIFLEIQL
jgi:hypothetical protein